MEGREGASSSRYCGSSVVVGSTAANFQKLEGRRNFNTWRFAMEMYLVDCDLWDCVQCPNEMPPNELQRRDARARAKICLMCTEKVYPVVATAKTAQDTWNSLVKAYADGGLSRRLSLLKKLFNTKLTQFNNIEEYINDIRDTQQSLAAINAAVEDEFVGVIMLAGLTEKYDPLVMALEHSGATITSDSVSSTLLKEDQRLDVTDREEPSALMTTKSKAPVCYYCKEPGHYKNKCRKYKREKKNNAGTETTSSANFSQVSLLGYSNTVNSCFLTNFKSNEWFIDSGATSHMTPRRECLINYSETESKCITVANKEKIFSKGVGDVPIQVSPQIHNISNVMYVPNLATNLLSVNSLVNKGLVVVFSKNGCNILLHEGCNVTGNVVATASNVGGMFKLNVESDMQAQLCTTSQPIDLWQRRLDHLNTQSLNVLRNKNVGIEYKGSDITNTCVPCIQGKLAMKPFHSSEVKSKKKLELIHSDLCGPMSCRSWGGALYLLTFTDDYTRKTFGYVLRNKSEVFSKFVLFKNLVENQTGEKIKSLRTDNGGEYICKKMQHFLEQHGIIHQLTVPYCPQQNGVAERVNRTVVEKARSMLEDSKLSRAYLLG